MKYIKREIQDKIKDNLFKGKIVILYGPRQVGKTTMIKEITKDISKSKYYSCDDPAIRHGLENKSLKDLELFIRGYDVVIFDEAQMVENIGVSLKILHDAYPKVQIVATGSSSFELANKIKEPLTGRALEYTLLPLSSKEISNEFGVVETKSMLDTLCIYGSYPDVLFGNINKEEALINISNQYLYKDLLKFEGIRKPELLEKILKLLATSIGQEVSYTEMANTLQVHKSTVETYISYLEQAFIVYKVLPYYKNIRSQVTKKRKIYFYDNGMRNAILSDFNIMENRIDKGNLWENFVFSDIRKNILVKNNMHPAQYFIRIYGGQEVDMLLEEKGMLTGIEIKYKESKIKTPEFWKREFPEKKLILINKDNYLS